MASSRFRFAFLFAVCAAFVSAVQAQDVRVTDPKMLAKMGLPPDATVYIAKGAILDQTGTSAPQFGITTPSSSTSQGNSFHARTSTGSEYTSPGGVGDIAYSAGDIFWDAQLDLPTGAVWDDTSFWGSDSDAVNDLNFFLFESCQPPGAAGPPVFTVLGSGSSTGSAGSVFGTFVIGAPPTIDNDSCIYWNRVRFDAVGLTLQKVRSHWHRQVSPAPAVAFFSDVPTTDFAFQFVEAFAAAGITVGCTDNLPFPPPVYCPDRNVTRREMAVFFAKALGLHFPN